MVLLLTISSTASTSRAEVMLRSMRARPGVLFVLQPIEGLGADAFKYIDAPVDGTQIDVERPH